MRIRRRPEANGTSRSRTFLLRLGFAEWWRAQLAQAGDLLFPELPASETDGKLSDLFGKHRRRIFEHIGILDRRKDFYAGRMTVATELLALGAPDHVRQSILGHEHGSVINRHYTQANLELMKSFLDRIDLGLAIEVDARRGFPVIRGCTLLKEMPLRVNLTLDANNQPRCIEIHEPTSGVSHVIMPERPVDLKDRAAVAENLDRMGGALPPFWRIGAKAWSTKPSTAFSGFCWQWRLLVRSRQRRPSSRTVPRPARPTRRTVSARRSRSCLGRVPAFGRATAEEIVAVHPNLEGQVAETTGAGP